MVRIHTDYCVKTQEEIDAILEEVKRTFLYYWKKEQLAKMQKEKENKNKL